MVLTVQKWHLDTGMKLNIGKTTVITFTHKTPSTTIKNYRKTVACSQRVKYLVILINCTFQFQSHAHYIFLGGLKILSDLVHHTFLFNQSQS
jgi:hypothetical protein